MFVCTTGCRGDPSTVYGCCSSSKQCVVGQGVCGQDSDCGGRLICGKDNCKEFSTPSSNWTFDADCCTGKLVCVDMLNPIHS